jgi:glycosyltransferase involved in cell wall biosynthesis
MNWPGAQRKMKVLNPGRTIGAMYQKNEARTMLANFSPSLGVYQKDFWIGMVAELHPIKRHNVLIASISRLVDSGACPNLRILLIGDGSERVTIEADIKTRGLQDHIFLLGTIVEAGRFLRAFDLFVLPSKSESYGYVIHEAGLAELPVVATHVGGIPDIIIDQKTGTLVPPDDATALADALAHYITNESLRRTHGTALAHSLESRSVEAMTRDTVTLYTL